MSTGNGQNCVKRPKLGQNKLGQRPKHGPKHGKFHYDQVILKSPGGACKIICANCKAPAAISEYAVIKTIAI